MAFDVASLAAGGYLSYPTVDMGAPSNGEVKLSDFGIARELEGETVSCICLAFPFRFGVLLVSISRGDDVCGNSTKGRDARVHRAQNDNGIRRPSGGPPPVNLKLGVDAENHIRDGILKQVVRACTDWHILHISHQALVGRARANMFFVVGRCLYCLSASDVGTPIYRCRTCSRTCVGCSTEL